MLISRSFWNRLMQTKEKLIFFLITKVPDYSSNI